MKYYLPEHIKANAEARRKQSIQGTDAQHLFFEQFFTQKAIRFYVVALLISNVLFFKRLLNPIFIISGLVEVYAFFYFSTKLSKKWNVSSEKKFLKQLFLTGLIIRIIWVIFSYFFYWWQTGTPFEWAAADSTGYDHEAGWLADLINDGKIQTYYDYIKGRYSDMGYTYYLGWQYLITGKSIIIARLLKAVYGAFTAILIYRLAKRNFGDGVGRLSGIFIMLMPNLILYSGLHLKEVEMVMLTALFMEQADKLIRERVFNFSTLIIPVLAGGSLFFFRTVLGATAVFALLTALMLTTDKIMGMGKRMIIILWVVLAGSYFIGGKIMTEVEEVWNSRKENQATSLEMRTNRVNGNKFAKYAGAAVFAPMIYVIPFPTVIDSPNQQNQQFINGGNFTKNVLAFFVILGVIFMIKERKWREHLLILSFTTGYLIVLAFSAFAQAERFHQPALPFELLLAAYGISRINRKNKKYFQWWLVLLVVIIVCWSWFKLAGRGMS